jgi:hypothetical protein
MKDPNSKERLVIADPAQAAMLTDRRALRYLVPFLCEEHTLSSAAAAVGVRPSTMAYWLPRFCSVGLVTVTGRRKRAGMASACYRSAADVFVLEAGQVEQQRLEAFLTEPATAIDEQISQAARRMDIWSQLRLELRGDPQTAGIDIRIRPAERDDQGVVVLQLFDALTLSREQARELRGELIAVIQRYKTSPGRGGDYLVHLALAPDT